MIFYLEKCLTESDEKRDFNQKSPHLTFSHHTLLFGLEINTLAFPHFIENHPKPYLLLDIISILTQDNILSISILLQSHTPTLQSQRNPYKPQNQSQPTSISTIFRPFDHLKPQPHSTYHRNYRRGYPFQYPLKKLTPTFRPSVSHPLLV